MNYFTPKQVSAVDQVHIHAINMLDSMVAETRREIARHKEEGTELTEVESIATLAAGLLETFKKAPDPNPVNAMVLAAALHRLAAIEE